MQRFERIYDAHHDAVRAYVRRRAPADAVDDVVADRCTPRATVSLTKLGTT